MKEEDFKKLSPELQKEFLARGGKIEYPSVAGKESLEEMKWNHKTRFGRKGAPKDSDWVKKNKKWRKKLK